MSYKDAQIIVKKSNQLVAAGLKNRKKKPSPHPRGKEPLLNPKQLKKLKKCLKGKPADGVIWSRPKVARWLQQETGREKVGKQRGWEYLKKCNYSWQRPRPKHKKGNPKKQE